MPHTCGNAPKAPASHPHLPLYRLPASQKPLPQGQNKQKNYLLQEGKPIPFLIELGIMNKEGKILAQKFDKFKQINRFLEFVADILPEIYPIDSKEP